ncbi:MAG: hypothetical protein HKN21_06965 [Candidatus Eisenbacteria bacterium]|uniref:DJ-1/PfpI domain-containing protein n=1 Tax=Eiseniibacteriota bacterium TaxID=2212470 RepID=A0A7Y2H1W8_UNCEI|nr:hypothetical protein [Candidatus Eisenbacteria bacterium]
MEKKLLVLTANGFADQELLPLLESLKEAGVTCTVASPKKETLTGLEGGTLAAELKTKDVTLDLFDGVLLTGGMAPLALRVHEDSLQILRECFETPHKPVFTMGLGAQSLISAKVLAGRSLTADPAIHDDLRLAGARVFEKKATEQAPLYSVRSEKEREALEKMIAEAFEGSKDPNMVSEDTGDGEASEDTTPQEAPA